MSCVCVPLYCCTIFKVDFVLFWFPFSTPRLPGSHSKKPQTSNNPNKEPPIPANNHKTSFALPSLVPDQITLNIILMASAMVLDKSLDDVSSRCSAPTMPNRFRRSFLRRGGILAVPVALLVLPRLLSPARPPLRPPHGAQLLARRLCQATSSPRKSSCPTFPPT